MKRTRWQFSLRAILIVVTVWASVLSVWKMAGLRAVAGLLVLVVSVTCMCLTWYANTNLGITARLVAAVVVGLVAGLVAAMALPFVLVEWVWL